MRYSATDTPTKTSIYDNNNQDYAGIVSLVGFFWYWRDFKNGQFGKELTKQEAYAALITSLGIEVQLA